MTLKQALAVLVANDAAAEGTFMHAVHERARFDKATFWSLYTAAVIIGQTPPRARGSGARHQAFRVYKSVLESIIYHFQPQDGYRMRGLPRQTLSAHLARLEWAFEPVIMGKRGYRWVADFGDGLTNPHQASLARRFGPRTKARRFRQPQPCTLSPLRAMTRMPPSLPSAIENAYAVFAGYRIGHGIDFAARVGLSMAENERLKAMLIETPLRALPAEAIDAYLEYVCAAHYNGGFRANGSAASCRARSS